MTDAPIKDAPIKDASASHWVYRLPQPARAFAQLSRLDRPVGYWLLTLPGWIGLAFASLSHGFAVSDLKWAALILIGAIAMRGAGCTYNDIVDQDLDARVERTALRPLPAGTVTTKQAWIWLLAQCAVGLIVLLCLPRLAQIISLCSIPLVVAYPFMKRITWWPQVWLGLTFNWAVLVAYAAKTGAVSAPLFILYLGLIFWTVGYDTIYACQDIEDDAMIGVKSTARRFGKRVKLGVGASFTATVLLVCTAGVLEFHSIVYESNELPLSAYITDSLSLFPATLLIFSPLGLIFLWQVITLNAADSKNSLLRFKSNLWAGLVFIIAIVAPSYLIDQHYKSYYCESRETEYCERRGY